MEAPTTQSTHATLARQAAKLWPHREHEANIILGQLCRLGWHRWRKLDLAQIAPAGDIQHCFWCSMIKIDGTAHDPRTVPPSPALGLHDSCLRAEPGPGTPRPDVVKPTNPHSRRNRQQRRAFPTQK